MMQARKPFAAAIGFALLFTCLAGANAIAADSAANALERAGKRVVDAVAIDEIIPAAHGTLKQQAQRFTVEQAVCLAAMEPRMVANRIGYPLAEDFSKDEFLALARFIDTPDGARIQQARAERLASGNLVFRLTPEESAIVSKSLPAALARKWSAGAAMQPNTARAMRAVFEERQAICRNTRNAPPPAEPPAVNYREGLPPNVRCTQPRLSLVGAPPDKPVSVTVRIWVGADGSVARTAVEKASGSDAVDGAARGAMMALRCSAQDSGALSSSLTPFTVTQSFSVQAGR